MLFVSAVRADDPAPGEPAAGHSQHGEAFDQGPRQAAYLMPGTGHVHFLVSTKHETAQQFFDQGVGQLHGFWYFEAERSFRQAAALDPDLAMAYWGMAMANVNNGKRAKQFIDEAVKRQSNADTRESLWIAALAQYYRDEPTARKDNSTKDSAVKKTPPAKKRPEADRRKQYLKQLESIVFEYPDDLEAKALLAVFLWQSRDKGLPITSPTAVDALMDVIFLKEPLHPAHHYRIHLWDGDHSTRALASAARGGQSAPGIAHMWHMPGHTYSKLHRLHDAAWQQEAASRVDHAHMIRDRVMPDEIHNYAHNQEWLIRTLISIGRAHQAVELAKNMIELPRHPRYNTLGKAGTSSAYGRTRLLDTLVRFELWDDLIALAATPYLEPQDNRADQLKLARALGAAYFATHDTTHGQAQIDKLEKLLADAQAEQRAAGDKAEETIRRQQPKSAAPKANDTVDAKRTSESSANDVAAPAKPQEVKEDKSLVAKIAKARQEAEKTKAAPIKELEQALAELRGHQATEAGDPAAALKQFEQAKLGKEFMSRAQAAAGNKKQAEDLARQAVDAAENHVYPLANLVDVLHRLDDADAAANALGRLRGVSPALDMDLAIVARLASIAKEHKLPADWRRPLAAADDVGERPSLDSLGPMRWSPAPAPTFRLPKGDEQTVSLDDYRGRPVVLVFYLGFGCLHCVEQLQAFAPLASKFEEAGIDLLAISSDSPEALQKSIDKFSSDGKFPLPLISDADLKTFKAYRAFDDFEQSPLHATVVVDGRGRIIWQDIGPEPFADAAFVLKETQRLMSLWGGE